MQVESSISVTDSRRDELPHRLRRTAGVPALSTHYNALIAATISLYLNVIDFVRSR